MLRPRASRRLPAIALAASVAVAACGTTAPSGSKTDSIPTVAPTGTGAPSSTSPSQDSLTFAAIQSDVEAIRGLEPKAEVDPVTIGVDQLEKNLELEFDAENPPAEVADAEAMLIALGLLPPGSSLRELTLDFQSGQVAGYYSPDKDQLFVVSRGGKLGASDRVTYAHEFTHQLQDQNFGLDKLQLEPDQSDRSLARLALIEGDAVSVQTTWMQGHLTSEEMGELLAVALSPESIEALRRAPPYLRETALFPYNNGLAFVAGLLAGGGYQAVDGAYADLPASTEQILHPELYASREAPIQVSLPSNLAARLGADWSVAGQDTLGEMILGLWLRQGGITAADATRAAAGWGGDRAVLVRGPGGPVAVGIRTAWDSPADAAQFATAAGAAIGALGLAGEVVHDTGSREVIVAVGGHAAEVAGAIEE
jgi:hypothetical protein